MPTLCSVITQGFEEAIQNSREYGGKIMVSYHQAAKEAKSYSKHNSKALFWSKLLFCCFLSL